MPKRTTADVRLLNAAIQARQMLRGQVVPALRTAIDSSGESASMRECLERACDVAGNTAALLTIAIKDRAGAYRRELDNLPAFSLRWMNNQ